MVAFDARNANVHHKTKKQSDLLLNGWKARCPVGALQ
jgi:hypothetical protein